MRGWPNGKAVDPQAFLKSLSKNGAEPAVAIMSNSDEKEIATDWGFKLNLSWKESFAKESSWMSLPALIIFNKALFNIYLNLKILVETN